MGIRNDRWKEWCVQKPRRWKKLARVMGLWKPREEAGEISSALWWRVSNVTWKNGKPLKDCKQRCDITRFTMPVISPSPLIFDFSTFEKPTLSWRVTKPGWLSPVQIHAVQLPLIVLSYTHRQLAVAFPVTPNLFLLRNSQLHHFPSPLLQRRY